MGNNFIEATLKCQKCGAEFQGKIYLCLSHKIPQQVCPQCSEKILEQERKEEEMQRQTEIASIRKIWRENCGIDPKYMGEDFSTFDTKRSGNINEIYKKCVDYAEQFPIQYDQWLRRAKKPYPSLLLLSVGVWGNGKTHLVSAIAHRIFDRWQGEHVACPVHLISEPELYGRIQQTFNYTYAEREEKQSEQDIINHLCKVRLLIIDDLGKQPRRDMDFVRRTMFDIINRRYKAMLPVVITTNKDTEGLRDYLGSATDEATLDRIIEMTEGKFSQVKGTSYRRIKK